MKSTAVTTSGGIIKRLLFLFLFSITAFAREEVECIGPEGANKFIVYLHGMDTNPPSAQELQNRVVLSSLAKKLNVRFALPRAADKCPTHLNQFCWVWWTKTADELKKVTQSIAEASRTCFPGKKFSTLGFSNGGAALNVFIRLCIKNNFQEIITVGAAGDWSGSDPKNLNGCSPKFTALIGSEDEANQKPVRDFVSHLLMLKARAELIEYKGGHQLLHDALEPIIKRIR